MGKLQNQRLPVQQQEQEQNYGGFVSRIFFQRCSMGLSRIGLRFSFKCIVVLLLSIAVFLSAVFWIIPHHSKPSGFDAKEAIKLSSTVQACFKLEKPVSELVPRIARLEYDITGELGIPSAKVAILSMHGAGISNLTDVTFGFLPDPINASISTAPLSLLRSSLLDLFSREINLTLTTSIFGQPSSFEILKFPGGITMIPEPMTSFLDLPEVLFNFTLHNSIKGIKETFIELKEQLKSGLDLMPDENIFLQITNTIGSTKDSPVIVDASVMSDLGSLLPRRLQQLAEKITGSAPAANLGLDNSVFGKVKQVRLSSFLSRTLHADPPAPTPAPTPAPAPAPVPSEQLWPSPTRSPAVSPSLSPAPLPKCQDSVPCSRCHRFLPSDARHHCGPPHGKEPSSSLSPVADPPSPVEKSGPCSSVWGIAPSPSPLSHGRQAAPNSLSYAPTYPIQLSPSLKLSAGVSRLTTGSYGSSVGQNTGDVKDFISPPQKSSSILCSSSSFAPGYLYKEHFLFWLFGFIVLHILSWAW